MNKPLTKTERKILIRNKMKRGKSYEQAYKEISEELAYLDKMSKNKRIEGREKEKLSFKEEFEKLKEGS